MNKKHILCILLSLLPLCSFSQTERDKIQTIVELFFDVIGKKDSIAYKNMFLKDGYKYTIRERQDSLVARGTSALKDINFASPDRWREGLRAKGLKIEVHKRIAMAWVPYDFFVNNAFSHCGVDVFTFMKVDQEWKIAVIAYSVEREGCKDW